MDDFWIDEILDESDLKALRNVKTIYSMED